MYKQFTVAKIEKSERKTTSMPMYLTNKGPRIGKERDEVETTFVITDTVGAEYLLLFYRKESIQRVYQHQIIRCYLKTSDYLASAERPRITRLFTKQQFEENIGKRIGWLQEETHKHTIEMEALRDLLK